MDSAAKHSPNLSNKSGCAQDDLFENSSMTFGEHLEELRYCLIRAILSLAVGLGIGLTVANKVVRYVSEPLKEAILDFNAKKNLAMLGYADQTDPKVQALLPKMIEQSLKWQVVYEIPSEFQAQPSSKTNTSKPAADTTGQVAKDESKDPPTVQPVAVADGTTVSKSDLAAILLALPSPDQLVPKVQLIRDTAGLTTLKVEESFMIWVKAGLIVGAVVSSPAVFYFLWQFIAAGLHRHERKYVYIYLPVSVTLFVSGVVLAFFLVLHYVLNFLLEFNGSMDVEMEPRLTHYINFVLLLPLGFGLAFQLPLVMLFLQRIGLIETTAYIGSWRIAILVIFFLSMVLTPADVTSMIALAIPLMFLYFLGILMCHFIPRGPGLGSGAYDPA
ncbi:twin-arginine translocase subunit TatC [Rhodopirellula sp. MGV]|uniref:twin-arginine translocase subunit TatC n=1 Tax=Rhodopirellula sp. MGV TaxID=2023130 RepID=UPI000B977262|nr:twin-arginine translocase subunit TatC [Rhodopirellula sp. MGV]OYP29421.1 twin-arginine translocase subunit TatC [Rhodopirellula sp. MGV]PNY35727.1 twin-arginine translocase subunit TatC [Rhodopirellula baltica]